MENQNQTITLHVTQSWPDFAWVFAEYTPGKRITKEMISFDCQREDVRINPHGVVLFFNQSIAAMLLKKDFPHAHVLRDGKAPQFPKTTQPETSLDL